LGVWGWMENWFGGGRNENALWIQRAINRQAAKWFWAFNSKKNTQLWLN